MQSSAAQVAAPAQRYVVLDGLRGFAALAVVIFHIGSRVGAPIIVTHGYLAVDFFFFILSGFVIAHSLQRPPGKPGLGGICDRPSPAPAAAQCARGRAGHGLSDPALAVPANGLRHPAPNLGRVGPQSGADPQAVAGPGDDV